LSFTERFLKAEGEAWMQRTLYRYAQMIKDFMECYGEPIDDLKIRVPKSIPKYTEDESVSKERRLNALKSFNL